MWPYLFWNWFPAIFQRPFSALSYSRCKDVQFSLNQLPFAWLHCVFKFFGSAPWQYTSSSTIMPLIEYLLLPIFCTASRANPFSTKWAKKRESRINPSEMIKLFLKVWKLRSLENVSVSLTKLSLLKETSMKIKKMKKHFVQKLSIHPLAWNLFNVN